MKQRAEVANAAIVVDDSAATQPDNTQLQQTVPEAPPAGCAKMDGNNIEIHGGPGRNFTKHMSIYPEAQHD